MGAGGGGGAFIRKKLIMDSDEESTESKEGSTSSVEDRKSLADTMVVLLSFYRREKLTDPDLLYVIAEFVGLSQKIVASRSDGKRGASTDNENRMDLLSSLFKERLNKEETLASLCLAARFDLESVRYEARAKDQGWSSYREDYGKRTSHTWGEAQVSIKRLADLFQLLPSKKSDESAHEALPRYRVYRNIHAGDKFELHDYTFSRNTAFVRSLGGAIDQVRRQRALDVASLLHQRTEGVNQERAPETILEISCQFWCRSEYPAWRHYVLSSSITTEWRMRKEAFLGQIEHYSNLSQNEG